MTRVLCDAPVIVRTPTGRLTIPAAGVRKLRAMGEHEVRAIYGEALARALWPTDSGFGWRA